jgi:hypothetical protein
MYAANGRAKADRIPMTPQNKELSLSGTGCQTFRFYNFGLIFDIRKASQ